MIWQDSNLTNEETEAQRGFRILPRSQNSHVAKPELKSNTSGPCLVLLPVCVLSYVQLFHDPMNCSLPSLSVHGIFQARILEWVAIFLFQGIFLTQGLNQHLLCLLCCRWVVYPLSQQGSPFFYGYVHNVHSVIIVTSQLPRSWFSWNPSFPYTIL